MLVLARRVNESIMLTVPPSDTEIQIRVTVVDRRQGKARIGIQAPPEVRIAREEAKKGAMLT